ncbi:APC family permease [Metallosphaera javensis (ex Sakai et al. 2022)]|uniref:APC family permease n=1 Tax=Metallosphaera javensis (ex Sakai et al. 2022) TaxID=2775498 RepID=UPI00258DBF68|nr:MAG: amino acid transporter [Metallosphaera javensis (ex Sakai et al. 2022)]
MSDPKGMKKEIGLTSLIIIGLASAVATAIFFSPLQMTEVAGPGSLIAWVIAILFYVTISITYIELSQTYPEAGGPSRYSIYSHGSVTNLINAMADLLWYLFIPPIEAFATIEGLDYIFPSLLNSKGFPTLKGALVGVVLMFGYIPFNYYGVKTFSRITSGFGTVKYIIYILPAFLLLLTFLNLKNFTVYGVLPFGFAGIFSSMPYAMFAFGGARVIPDFAEEVKKKSYLIYALIITVIGEGLVYLLFDFTFIANLDWAKLGLTPGDWSSLNKVVGNPFIVLAGTYHSGLGQAALALLLIGGIVGPFLTGYVYMGGGARVLFASARSGFLHEKFKSLHSKYAIPYWGLLLFAVVGAVIAFLFAPVPSIYGLIDDATVAGYIGFATNPVAMMVLRKQGVTKWRIKGGTVISPIAFAASSLIVFWSGWPAVPYSVIILAVITAILGIVGKVSEGMKESTWYMGYITFLTLMTYVGSDGALNVIPFLTATLITVVVSLVLFYPLGIYQGLKERNYLYHQEASGSHGEMKSEGEKA